MRKLFCGMVFILKNFSTKDKHLNLLLNMMKAISLMKNYSYIFVYVFCDEYDMKLF